MHMLRISRILAAPVAALALLLLTACGGGSGTSGDTGRLSLYVTDAPVDSAEKVVVAFTGVQLKPADGEPISYPVCEANESPCEPRKIDLLALTGDHSAALLEDEVLPAGRYEWIRLEVLTSQTSAENSYIFIDGAARPLWVPSGDQTGLKLVQGFTVPAGGVASFTIDFDLRKSIANPQGPLADTYFLRPALRLVDNSLTGHIEGQVAADLIEGEACLGNEPPGVGIVYVFDAGEAIGHETKPEDAVTSAKVDSENVDDDTLFSYRVGFLAAGEGGTEYLVQLWCETTVDGSAEGIALAEEFATIFPGESTTLDLNLDDALDDVGTN
jgi:hypothetical protein